MRWILRFRVYVIIFLAVVLISAAVIFSVLRATLPYATGYKNEIQKEISQQIDLPVEIDSIDAAIHWFSPRLKLINVTIYDKDNKVPLFNFEEAFVELDVIASVLRADFIVDEVGLVGADLSIEKLSENEWSVQGVKFNSEGSSELPDAFIYMLQNSDYLLHDSNIYYQDHTGEKLNLALLDVNIDVNNSFNNHDIKFSMNLPDEFGRDLAVVAQLSGDIDSLDGNIYIEAHQVKVQQWQKKFKLLPEYRIDSDIDINLWLVLNDNTIERLSSSLTTRELLVRNNATSKTWKTDYLTTDLRYVNEDENWNITVSDFRFGDSDNSEQAWPEPANIIAGYDADDYYLSADFLRVADLQEMAQVFLDKDGLENFDKLKAYKFQADIYNLNARLPNRASGQDLMNELFLQFSVNDLYLHDHESGVTLSGLDTSFLYANKKTILQLASQDTSINIPGLFRDPIVAATLQGKIDVSHDTRGWTLDSDRLHLKNQHIDTFSRLAIQFPRKDNIFIDVQTDFYDAYAKNARYYLPVGVMSQGLVDWLDMAVTDGYVPGGQFILHGELDSFPYDEHDGVFQVLFPANSIDMRFLKGWPLLKQASATVKFHNKSLVVSGASGESQGAKLFNGQAEIPDLTDSHLTVTTDAHGKNEDVQSYIWQSPLDDVLGDAMRLFQFSGKSDLNLKIDVPLEDDDAEVKVKGHLKFIDTDIYYPALGYEITGINGAIEFTKASIFAESMQAKIQGETVSLNTITRDGESGREVIFHLDGAMSADYLLQRYDWIPEDWISGKSVWSLDIEVPYEPEDYLVRIKADSYLQGVEFRLSDKVHKPSASKVLFTTAVNVLDENDLHVDAKADMVDAGGETAENVFGLYAVRDENNVWEFDIESKYIAGKGEFAEGLGKDTEMKLDIANIDLYSLFYVDDKKESEPLRPTDFPPLNWKLKKASWDGWIFSDVVLQTDWHKHGMLINKFSLKGPAMSFGARGTWLKSWRDSQETVLQGTMTSLNLGATLTGLGFQQSIDRANYKSTFNARWPAAPHGLSWANVKGKTTFEMENGEILDVEPGAGGRLLGLMNIFKLTNRLAFDFDDVTRKGFSFDSIKGEFEFVNGDGALEKFDVSAPAADVNIFGSIGLIDRDYGLLMRVKPHTDTLTFAGGALLGGVAVGAGLALIQKVFDLGVLGHTVYSITGSWDDPEIEKIVERTISTTEDEDF